MQILITWSIWFIWYSTAIKLLSLGFHVIWIDNEEETTIEDFKLKEKRKLLLMWFKSFHFYKWDIEDRNFLNSVFEKELPTHVIHLAAQSNIRNSQLDPHATFSPNISWFINVIEFSRLYNVDRFIYASSSSVYWTSDQESFSVSDNTDKPDSIYSATKKANEIIAYTYSKSYWLKTTWLRFFTVYWPFTRTNLVTYTFLDKIYKDQPIDLYNYGNISRDFIYIDDIVNWIICSIKDESKCEIYNLWTGIWISLDELVSKFEKILWKNAIKNYLPGKNWDFIRSQADIDYTTNYLWWKPIINIDVWLNRLTKWYIETST